MISSISKPLMATLKELMQIESLDSFYLGGGTNLALKYNHRISLDIDLFSKTIVGSEHIEAIRKDILLKYPESKILSKNRESDSLSFLTGVLVNDGYRVKIDVIQNLKLLKEHTIADDIRLIDDFDVASLKLDSMANRGSRKDLYDLVLLTNHYKLSDIFDLFTERKIHFNRKTDKNIFNETGFDRADGLLNDLGPLVNFNNTKDLSVENNKVMLTSKSPFALDSFIDICGLWKSRVVELSRIKNIKLTPQKSIPARRRKKGLGL